MNEARVGLTTLAEVYRAARVLWPLRKWGGDEATSASGDGGMDNGSAATVTVMIDELKSCGSAELLASYAEGMAWVLVKNSTNEASVRRKPLRELPTLLSVKGQCELLRLWTGGGCSACEEALKMVSA